LLHEFFIKRPSKSKIVAAGWPQLKCLARETHKVHSTTMRPGSTEFKVIESGCRASKRLCKQESQRRWRRAIRMPFKTARSMVLILEKLFLMPAIPLVGCWPQRRFAAMQHDIGNREQTGRSADEARTTARDSSERVM
jgi:hypothetical protein